jgi:hypothetical protein
MATTVKEKRYICYDYGYSWVGPPRSDPPPVTLNSTTQLVGVNQRTPGGSCAGFRRKISLGNSATTLFNADEVGFEALPHLMEEKLYNASFNTQLWRGRRGTACTFPELPTPGYLDTTKALNQARRRFINKARDAQTSIMGEVVLGELMETLRMIRNPAKLFRTGLGSFVNDVRKYAKKHGRKSAGKFAADSWLQNSFGWQPLLRDIDSAAKALAAMNAQRLGLVPVIAYGRNQALLYVQDQVSGNNAPQYYVNKRAWQDNLVILRGAVRVRTHSDSPALMAAENFGFNLSSFIPSVWELIPYSFLVDYFTNIGDILNAWSFGSNSLSWSCQTVVKRVNLVNVAHSPNWTVQAGYVNQGKVFKPGAIRTWRKSVDRGEPGSLVPSFEWNLPEASSTRWLNLAALATSRAL